MGNLTIGLFLVSSLICRILKLPTHDRFFVLYPNFGKLSASVLIICQIKCTTTNLRGWGLLLKVLTE